MAASAGPGLQRLYREYGDRVQFVTVYVREAHPGERVPQPDTLARKKAHARAYQRREGIRWPVLVDDLDGTVHHLLGRLPDAAYLVGQDGRVASRLLWSSDLRGLRAALRTAVGERPRGPARRYATVVPLLRGAGVTSEILAAAGPSARRDMLRTAPPLYALSRLAAVFRPLPPLARTTAALVLTAAATLTAAALWRRLRTR